MPATSGRAVVAGYDVFSQALEVRRRVGYLPENVPLYPGNDRTELSAICGRRQRYSP